MVKTLVLLLAGLTAVLLVSPVAAQPQRPEEAHADEVLHLGSHSDPQGGMRVEGRAIIHRHAAAAHSRSRQLLRSAQRSRACYAFLAPGTRWRSPEPWVINPSNQRSLDASTVIQSVEAGLRMWEDAADGVLGNNGRAAIFGSGTVTASPLSVDRNGPDGQNEVFFTSLQSSRAVAITYVWFSRDGTIAEWDQVYDDRAYDWSLTGESGKMDFASVALHELGHALGLGDLASSGCGEETMYGSVTAGETKKRTLSTGDIAGVDALY